MSTRMGTLTFTSRPNATIPGTFPCEEMLETQRITQVAMAHASLKADSNSALALTVVPHNTIALAVGVWDKIISFRIPQSMSMNSHSLPLNSGPLFATTFSGLGHRASQVFLKVWAFLVLLAEVTRKCFNEIGGRVNDHHSPKLSSNTLTRDQ